METCDNVTDAYVYSSAAHAMVKPYSQNCVTEAQLEAQIAKISKAIKNLEALTSKKRTSGGGRTRSVRISRQDQIAKLGAKREILQAALKDLRSDTHAPPKIPNPQPHKPGRSNFSSPWWRSY